MARDSDDSGDSVLSRYDLRPRPATTSLTTMARESAHTPYGLRPRTTTSSSQAVVRSTRQDNRSSRSRRALPNPTTPMPPSLPTLQVARIPFIPPEIMARILSHFCIHDEAITLLPTRESIEDQAAFNERMARLTPKELQKALGHRVRGPFKPSTTKMPITPPYQSHNAPVINLLLTSKLFHDEVIKQYYSKNIFTFLLGDGVWRNLSKSKKAHVRHIQLESLWELDINFSEVNHITQQAKATLSVKQVWGRSEIEGLTDLGDDTVCFPNLESITQRIRLSLNKNWTWPAPNKPNVLIAFPGNNVILGEDHDFLIYKEARDMMKSMVITEIQTRWEHLKTESYLAKMEIGFMYSRILEWDDEVAMKPFLSLV